MPHAAEDKEATMTLMLMTRTTSRLLARWSVWTRSGSHAPTQNPVLRSHA